MIINKKMKEYKSTALVTNIGKIETNMTMDELLKEVKDAKAEKRLAVVSCDPAVTTLNIGTENHDVNCSITKHLDLDEVQVVAYHENTYTPIKED